MTEEQQRYARAWRRFRWLLALCWVGALAAMVYSVEFLRLVVPVWPHMQGFVAAGAIAGFVAIGILFQLPYLHFRCPCCGKRFFDGPLKWRPREKICANCGTAFGMLPPSDANEARSHLYRNNRHPG